MSAPNPWSFDLYSRGQQVTIFTLVGIVAVLLLALKFYAPQPDYFTGREDLLRVAQQMRNSTAEGLAREVKPVAARFTFDPNFVSAEELQQLGLSSKQAQSWLKYRGQSTNRFRKPEDIARLFVLDSSDVAYLLPLVRLQSSKQSTGEQAGKQIGEDRSFDQVDKAPKQQWESFSFDPNSVSENELVRLGLSQKQAASFLKYRNSRSYPFRRAEELDKIRILKEDQKVHLKSLVKFEPSPAVADIDVEENNTDAGPALATYGKVSPPVPYEPAPPTFTMDVNTATTLDFEQIPGIGPYWAKRLVGFREKLGGFASLEQIGTTYNLPDSTYRKMLPYLELQTKPYRLLAVNLLEVDELKAHPFVNYKLASIIVKFRQQNGPFRSIEDLRRIRIFSKDTEVKLAPYLDYSVE